MHEALFGMLFCFRNGHSTEHALISLSEKIKSTLDRGNVGCGIFIHLHGPLIQSTIEPFCTYKNIMVSGELPFIASSHTCRTGNNLFL